MIGHVYRSQRFLNCVNVGRPFRVLGNSLADRYQGTTANLVGDRPERISPSLLRIPLTGPWVLNPMLRQNCQAFFLEWPHPIHNAQHGFSIDFYLRCERFELSHGPIHSRNNARLAFALAVRPSMKLRFRAGQCHGWARFRQLYSVRWLPTHSSSLSDLRRKCGAAATRVVTPACIGAGVRSTHTHIIPWLRR